MTPSSILSIILDSCLLSFISILMMTTIWSKRRLIKTFKTLFGVTVLGILLNYLGAPVTIIHAFSLKGKSLNSISRDATLQT